MPLVVKRSPACLMGGRSLSPLPFQGNACASSWSKRSRTSLAPGCSRCSSHPPCESLRAAFTSASAAAVNISICLMRLSWQPKRKSCGISSPGSASSTARPLTGSTPHPKNMHTATTSSSISPPTAASVSTGRARGRFCRSVSATCPKPPLRCSGRSLLSSPASAFSVSGCV
jgi:hypothetical protein